MRLPLALVTAAAAASFAAPAGASIYCSDLGPVPGYGPVCTVKCVLAHDPTPIDVKRLGESLSIVCPA